MEFSGVKQQYERYAAELDAAALEALHSGDYILGKSVTALEEELAAYVGRKHCVSASSGTDGLLMALMSENIGPGDCVFTTAFSFFATAECIRLTGAAPVFCDINPDTYNIDPYCLNQVIKRIGREGRLRPRAVITVDLFGLCADYERLEDICRYNDLVLIEDAAQSMGSEYQSRKAGTFGQYAATSFFPTKPLGCCGDGGAVFCDDDELAARLRSIRVHGMGSHKYENVRIGLNARLDEVQAALLRVKLAHFPDDLARRRDLAARYDRNLEGKVKRQKISDGLTSSYAQYTIALKDSDQRHLVQARLEQRNIPSAVYYPVPLNMQQAFRELAHHDMPNSRQAASRVLSLPMHPCLSGEEVDRICTCICEALESYERDCDKFDSGD